MGTTAVIVACMALAGHPEVATGAGLAAAGIGLGLRSRRVRLSRGLFFAALAAVLGLGLAAAQLVPFLRAIPLSSRATEGATRSVEHISFEWLDPRTWLMTPRFLIMPFNPYTFGTPYTDLYKGPFFEAEAGAGYAGLVVLAGCAVVLVASRARRSWPFLACAVVCFVLSTRPLPLLLPLAGIFPFLKALAYQRLLLVGSLCLSLAAAIGIREMMNRPFGRLWVGLLAAAAISVAMAPRVPVLVAWVLITGAALVGRTGRTLVVTGMLAAAMLTDLVPWGRHHLPRGRPELFYPRTELVAALVRHAGDAGSTRVVSEGMQLYPCLLPAYGVADARPHNPMAPAAQVAVLRSAFGFGRAYFSPLFDLDHPILDFLNVGYMVGGGVAKAAGLAPAEGKRYGGFWLLENRKALPRWFITRKVDLIESCQLEGWVAAMTDPTRIVLLRHELEPHEVAGLVQGSGAADRVDLLSSAPGRIELSLTAAAGGVLATSLPFPEGWRAETHDRHLRGVTVNGAFFGALLPRSKQLRVVLRFTPPGLTAGLLLSIVALAGTVLCLVLPGPVRRPPNAARPGIVESA